MNRDEGDADTTWSTELCYIEGTTADDKDCLRLLKLPRGFELRRYLLQFCINIFADLRSKYTMPLLI